MLFGSLGTCTITLLSDLRTKIYRKGHPLFNRLMSLAGTCDKQMGLDKPLRDGEWQTPNHRENVFESTTLGVLGRVYYPLSNFTTKCLAIKAILVCLTCID